MRFSCARSCTRQSVKSPPRAADAVRKEPAACQMGSDTHKPHFRHSGTGHGLPGLGFIILALSCSSCILRRLRFAHLISCDQVEGCTLATEAPAATDAVQVRLEGRVPPVALRWHVVVHDQRHLERMAAKPRSSCQRAPWAALPVSTAVPKSCNVNMPSVDHTATSDADGGNPCDCERGDNPSHACKS